MSRTIRGAKTSGYDFWSRRPNSGNGFGPIAKQICHRVERLQGRAEARRQIEEMMEANHGQAD